MNLQALQLHEKAVREIKSGNYEDALVAIEKAISIEPLEADLLSEKGVILFHLKRSPEALIYMNKARDREPDNPYRYSSRAFIKDSLGDTAGAIADYEICVKLDPEDAVAFNNLGMLEEKLGYMEKSKKSLAKADELGEMLSERGISPPLETSNEVDQIQTILPSEEPESKSEVVPEEPDEKIESKGKVILDVFRDKKTFKEFVAFVKRGFKNPKPGK
ncbi:MAG: hypothetical protein COB65_12905 [Thalassobium sp.]|nr:MAG: hypothetical protein COB65_12905 [Thalassobium sp.]